MSFTKHNSFYSLSLIPNTQTIISLLIHFLLTFFHLTIFPLTLFCDPNKALTYEQFTKMTDIEKNCLSNKFVWKIYHCH